MELRGLAIGSIFVFNISFSKLEKETFYKLEGSLGKMRRGGFGIHRFVLVPH